MSSSTPPLQSDAPPPDQIRQQVLHRLHQLVSLLTVPWLAARSLGLVLDGALGEAGWLFGLALLILLPSLRRDLAYRARALLILASLTLLSATVMSSPSLRDSGLILMLGTALLAGLLLELRHAVVTLAIGTALYLAVGGVDVPALLAGRWAIVPPDEHVLTQLIVFVLTGLALALALTILIRRLDAEWRRQRELAAALDRERSGLEAHVGARTEDLRRAAEVGRVVAAERELDPMLERAVELIRARFGLAHCQIYLVEEGTDRLPLRAASGTAGRRMLQRGDRVRLADDSPAGQAAAELRAILARVGEPRAPRRDPLLQGILAELAIPLLVENELVGILDLRADQPDTLTSERLPAFDVLAGQLAIAIDNALLFKQMSDAQQLVESQARRLTRKGWQAYLNALDRGERVGFVFDGESLAASDRLPAPASGADTLTVPLRVSGETIGAIRVEERERLIDEHEEQLVEAVGAQVVQQIENLRLLAETARYRSEAEAASRRLTRDGWKEYLAESPKDEFAFRYDGNRVTPAPEIILDPERHAAGALSEELRVRDVIVGSLEIAAEGLGEEDRALVRSVATQLSTHIETLRLLEMSERGRRKLDKRATQLETISEVSSTASSLLDSQRLLERVVELIQKRFALYHTQIFLLDPERAELRLAAAAGEVGRRMLAAGHRIPFDHPRSLVAQSARARRGLLVNDLEDESSHLPNPELPRSRAELTVPLVVAERVVGVLDVQAAAPDFFVGSDLETYSTLASTIASALENARLFEQVERNLAQTRLRFAVSQALASTQTEEEVLAAIREQAAHLPGARLIVMSYAWDENEPLTLVDDDHFPTWDLGLQPLLAPDEIFVSTNMAEDARLTEQALEPLGLERSGSLAVVPVVKGSQWLGALLVVAEEPDYFDDDRLFLIETLAEQGAVALLTARLFDETQRTAERLREVDRLKSEFLASMSHELRTPLNSIIGYAELILMSVDIADEMDPETKEDVRAIYDNGQHLLSLINDILDLAKIEAGHMELSREEVALPQLLEEVRTKNMGLLLKLRKSLEIHVDVAPDLPRIYGDRIRLHQILNNLVSNAVKFTEEGRIELRASRQGERVLIEVEDTGIGISREDLALIFDKFRQVDGSNTRRAEGTGLGLAITRHLVAMHGGELAARSELGVGTTFTVALPLRRPGGTRPLTARLRREVESARTG